MIDGDSRVVREHLEHLGLLPDKLLQRLKSEGMRVCLGNKDVLGLCDDEWLKAQSPRGWEGAHEGFVGVPGIYHIGRKTVYAGRGRSGSSSTVLHEYGHGVGELLGLKNANSTREAHQRMHKKLVEYLQQGGPGGEVGCEELLAESIADFFIKPKGQFIEKYDEDWHSLISRHVAQEDVVT